MVSNIKFNKSKEKTYRMHAHLNWNTQIMEDNV